MKLTTMYVGASLAIVLLLLQIPTVQSRGQFLEFNQWIRQVRDLLSWKPKRTCSGYMCGYAHIGSMSAQSSKNRHLVNLLYSCARNPQCSPGKRGKRSSLSTFSRSEQAKNTFMIKRNFPRIYELLKRNRKENIKSRRSE